MTEFVSIPASILPAVAAVVLAFPAHALPLQATPDGRRLVLTFSDDFHGSGAEPSPRWRTRFGDDTYRGLDGRTLENNGELEMYVDSHLSDSHGFIGIDPFQVDGDGHLEIVASRTPPALLPRLDSHPYVSGVITTQPSFAQTYGYFEMRAKLPNGKGLWPAFWLLRKDQSWPPEIDVMEAVSDPTHIYSTVHSTLAPAAGVETHVSPNAFHTFAVSWDPKKVIWYVDNRRIGAVPTPGDLHKPMYMIANLAVGGNWPGSPDAATVFPARLTIDYIRAYKFADE
ncbi:MAG: glycoside hydrolase family 16 protein [Rhizomicrobium sp.]